MIVSTPNTSPQSVVILISSSLLLLASSTCTGQVLEGEDQFQAYHHDIGRISGSQSGALVAPDSIVRQQAAGVQHVRPVVEVRPLSAATSRSREPLTSAQLPPPQRAAAASQRIQQVQPQPQQHHQAPLRKSNRVTLAMRQHAPVPEPIVEPAPAPISVQIAQPALPAPIVHQQAASVATNAAIEPNFATLMAQVAAERQASASQRGRQQALEHQQPSIGSPLEALPSPAQFQPLPLAAPNQLQPVAVTQAGQFGSQLAPPAAFGNQPEEQIEVPSFEHVLGNGCPHKGVFSWENKDHCDRYYMCTNGTFTEEACPNGLGYSQMGAVYQHCAYNWNVNCGNKKTAGPLASPGCPWQFGIFPVNGASQCSIDYFVCEWGVPETKRCHPEGLFYDDRIKGCQWADQLGCKSEALLNFKCPPEDEDNPFWPYPRYYHNKQDIIVCVNEQPRLVHCTEDQVVDPGSLSCMDLKKKKKKF